MLPLILALLPALALSALFAIAELALFSLGEARIRTLVEEGFGGSAALARLRERPRPLVVLLRAGKTFGDATAAAIASYAGFQIAGLAGVAVGVVIVFVLLLVVGELIPLSLVDDHIMRTALAMAPPLLSIRRILAPALRLLEPLVRKLPEQPTRAAEAMTEDEVRQITSIGRIEGVIGEHERQLIERAFRLDETKAWSIMTPRVDIFAWPDDLKLAEIATELPNVRFSRVPIFGESIDDITGLLYLRDAYQALVAGQRDIPLSGLAREPLIVPGSVSVTRLLREFQTRRIHLAVVVDEYGGTDGLVTLEDAMEELVGEIEDETDVTREPIRRISRHEIIAAGDADLREINHIFNTSFPQLEHRSLNGWLLEELGRVPEPGERVDGDGVVIEVLDASETQVVRARIRRVSAAEPAPRPQASAGDTEGGEAAAREAGSPASRGESREAAADTARSAGSEDRAAAAAEGAAARPGVERAADGPTDDNDRRRDDAPADAAGGERGVDSSSSVSPGAHN